jgi:hypothetical protein
VRLVRLIQRLVATDWWVVITFLRWKSRQAIPLCALDGSNILRDIMMMLSSVYSMSSFFPGRLLDLPMEVHRSTRIALHLIWKHSREADDLMAYVAQRKN